MWLSRNTSGLVITPATPANARAAKTTPQRPFRALSEPPPNWRRNVSERALSGQLGAPLRSSASCHAKGPSPRA
eukprot:8413007-Alexandrium_andersonii.AAC.1